MKAGRHAAIVVAGRRSSRRRAFRRIGARSRPRPRRMRRCESSGPRRCGAAPRRPWRRNPGEIMSHALSMQAPRALRGASLLAVLAALCGGLSANVVLAQAAPAATGAVKQYPLRDFFRKPERGYFRLSEDGKMLGFMQPWSEDGKTGRRLNIYVQRLEGSKPVGEPKRVSAETARDISNYFWKGGNTLLYQKDFGGDENFHVVAVDATTGKVRDLTPYEGVRASVQDALIDDPEHILVTHNRRNKEVFDVYRINVKTGGEKLVAQNPGNITDWTTDHAGRVRIGQVTDGVNNTIVYRASENDAFKPIISTDFKTQVGVQFFSADNKKFYAVSNRGRDKAALVLIDPARPDAEEVLFVHPAVDVAGAGYSRERKRLQSAVYETWKTEYKFFDDDAEKLLKAIQAKLPGYEITYQSNTRDETKFIVAATNDRTPGVRYIYDRRADSLTKLAEINPWIAEADMAPMKPISYTARDGLTINGYLTLPPGREPKNLACIVNPHGGPWARDSWGYNPEVQFLANRGYCVLQMNFRGSTGYGRAFWEKSFKQWGKTMQDDITDGTQWLIAQGIADPKRIGIYGGSYGGYATLAGVTFTPDLYAAAVDYVGVSNMFTFMKTIPPYWEPLRKQFYEMVGNPDDPKDKELLTAVSPVFNVDKIKTPLFVAQGAKDPRVNKAESDQIVEALRKRGIAVEYMVRDNEGHGFRNEENQFAFYEAMEKFFAQHLKP
jgi:dipeptidyl aminopeptidase/acylaminoacyl peptidase